LFKFGIASHTADIPAIAISALAITMLLVYRLMLELRIRADDDGEKLESAMRKINLINQLALVPIFVGTFGVMRKIAEG